MNITTNSVFQHYFWTARPHVCQWQVLKQLALWVRKHDVFVVQEHVCPCSGLAEKCAAEVYSHFVPASSNTHAANVNRQIIIQGEERRVKVMEGRRRKWSGSQRGTGSLKKTNWGELHSLLQGSSQLSALIYVEWLWVCACVCVCHIRAWPDQPPRSVSSFVADKPAWAKLPLWAALCDWSVKQKSTYKHTHRHTHTTIRDGRGAWVTSQRPCCSPEQKRTHTHTLHCRRSVRRRAVGSITWCLCCQAPA